MDRDAYFIHDNDHFRIGTGCVEKELVLTGEGAFYEMALTRAAAGEDRGHSAPLPQDAFLPDVFQQDEILQDEFYVTVDGHKMTGRNGGWRLSGTGEKRLSQNELDAEIVLENGTLRCRRHYIAYPGQPVLQSYTEFENMTNYTLTIDRPSLFVLRRGMDDAEAYDFSYMTGGANFTGSQMFKTVPLHGVYGRQFDSQKDPEVIEVEGETACTCHERYNGTGIWNEFFVLTHRERREGIFITFDYQGCWNGYLNCADGRVVLTACCDLHDYRLGPGETMRTAPSCTGLYAGDTDDLGNLINDYIYTYKWDYTRDAYFNRTSLCIWKAAPLNDRVFDMVQYAAYMGYERIWVDDFWFDAKGNYNPVWGDDWREANRFMREYGIRFRLWMPPWHADRLSQVWTEHPEWMLDFHGNWYNWTIDLSNEEAYQWVLAMLKRKQEEFGTYDLRVDGDPCNMGDNQALDQVTQNGDWNRTFWQSENFYRLYREFKEQNPEAGLDGCSSGGHTLTIESVRYCDQQQITDGQCRHYGGYWTTMILPIDKHQEMPIAGTSRPDQWQNAAHTYMNLFSAPADAMQNPEKGVDAACLEKKRRQLEMFYYLRTQGVYGRGILVYRPEAEHGDKTYLLQRMTPDRRRGMVMISANPHNPMLGKSDVIYVKGLMPEENYYVDSELGAAAPAAKTGAEWMRDGIPVSNVSCGEYIYLNLPDRPGHLAPGGTPETPRIICKRQETFMRHTGTAIRWECADQEVSHYEIAKNGAPYYKIARGQFFFDPAGTGSDDYEIRAVRYNGAKSEAARG